MITGAAEVIDRGLVPTCYDRDQAEIAVGLIAAGQVTKPASGLAHDLGCLVESGEHGQQPRTTQQRPGMRVLG